MDTPSGYLREYSYVERRRPGRLKFYDSSRTKVGHQSPSNLTGSCVNKLKIDWLDAKLSDDKLRVSLKMCFGMKLKDN